MKTSESTERAVVRWHEVVNQADLAQVPSIVGEPIVVNGPKGAGPISPEEFSAWIIRSGIQLRARSFHPISEEVLVVEQDAQWPQSAEPTRLATLFRAHDGRVTAALRFTTLHEALEFGYLYRELAATEPPLLTR